MKKVVAYLVGVLITYLLAVALVSQFNIARIMELGHAVTVRQRVETVLHDWLNMLGSYLPLICLAMLFAWLFTSLLLTRFVRRSALLYALAGFVGIVVMHLILIAVFGMTPVAPTRTTLGLFVQGLAGAVGGLVYYRWAFKQQATN